MDKFSKFLNRNWTYLLAFFLGTLALYIFLISLYVDISLDVVILLLGITMTALASIIPQLLKKSSDIEKKRLAEMKDKMIKNSDDTFDTFWEKYSSGLNVRRISLNDTMKFYEDSSGTIKFHKDDTVKSSEIEKINKKLDENDKQFKDLERELKKDLERELNNVLIKQKSQNNILELMFDNMGEIKDYFSISKRHARFSFWLAVINCIVGIVLLCLAVHFALIGVDIEPVIIATIAGAISELFAATSLVVHKKSLTQLNHYYNALHENEMFLSTLNLVGNLSIEKQDDMYIEIIKNELAVRQSRIASPKNSEAK